MEPAGEFSIAIENKRNRARTLSIATHHWFPKHRGSWFFILSVNCRGKDRDSGNRREQEIVGMEMSLNHFHKHNLRHLPRFPDFFVTFRILSPSSGNLVLFRKWHWARDCWCSEDGSWIPARYRYSLRKRQRMSGNWAAESCWNPKEAAAVSWIPYRCWIQECWAKDKNPPTTQHSSTTVDPWC